MYSTQPFLRGYNRARERGVAVSGAAGERRLKLLTELRNAKQGMTVFELAVKSSIRPGAVVPDLRTLSTVQLVDITGEGDDAVVTLTDAGRKYVEEIA